MGLALAPSPTVPRLVAALATGIVLLLALAASLLPSLPDCARDTGTTAPPSPTDADSIPTTYLALYRQAGGAFNVPWPILAGIVAIESDHGRSHAPGVHAGVNAFGCCAGPMQFNLRDGPPSTLLSYRADGDGDGDGDPYDPADAIATAGRYLHTLLERAHRHVDCHRDLDRRRRAPYRNDPVPRQRPGGSPTATLRSGRRAPAAPGCPPGCPPR